MIYNVNGKLTYTDVSFAVIECGGVGFKCFTSMNTLKSIGSVGTDVNLYTYLSIREDAMDLYGFSTAQELDAFKLLIGVSGIGPKAAVAVLNVLSPQSLYAAVSSGDVKTIQTAQGIGNKSAQRIVLELKDKIGKSAFSDEIDSYDSISKDPNQANAKEAVEVLVSLGFSQKDCVQAVESLDKSLTVDEMIRLGLKQLSAQIQ